MKLTCGILFCAATFLSQTKVGDSQNDDGKQKALEILQKCVDDLKLSKDLLNSSFLEKLAKAETDEPLRCFFKCFMQSAKSMDVNGTIVDPPDQKTRPAPLIKSFGECKARIHHPNACEKAFIFQKCLAGKALSPASG